MTIAEVHQAVDQIVSTLFYVHLKDGSIHKLCKNDAEINYRYENLNGISASQIKYINNDREEIG